jgi:secreted trypsin-like serine protease
LKIFQKNRSVCSSDEGSPVIKNGFVVGIVSFVGTACESGSAQLVTSLYPHYDWIVAQLKTANDGGSWYVAPV